MKISKLENEVEDMAKKLIECDHNCEGISNHNLDCSFSVPRGMHIYRGNGMKGAIVIGVNPGHAKKEEKKRLKKKLDYNTIKQYWEDKYIKNNKKRKRNYFITTIKLLKKLGFDGPIIWTDLAKCECKGKNKKLPIQTLRTCINKWLEQELEIYPKNYPIICLGRTSFDFCGMRFPNRLVIGLPHPSGQNVAFYDKVRKLNQLKIQRDIERNPDGALDYI